MKDFSLDSMGDVIIFNNDIEMVNGDDLTRQQCEMVVGTNKGEWFLDITQGIDFHAFIGKNRNTTNMRDEIEQALKLVDDTFSISNFDCQTENRKLVISFTAVNESGESISLTISDGEVQRGGETI